MSGKRKTGVAAIRRWRANRPASRRGVVPTGAGRFAEDLALFERQVREEAWQGTGCPTGTATSDPPAASAA